MNQVVEGGTTREDLADILRGDIIRPAPTLSPEEIAEHLLQHPATGPLLRREQPSPAEPATFALQWSGNRPPCEECRYDHCTAETPFGSFLITWMSWKKYDSPIVDETPWGDFWQAFATVELAKAACQREFDARLALCGLNRPAPAEPADMAVEQLQHIIHREPWATWLRPGGCLESAHCELTDLLSSVIAADRARRPTPPAEGEAGELAECREALRRVRRWGSTFGSHYSSAVAMGVMDWIDAGMTGPLPAMPEYLEGRSNG